MHEVSARADAPPEEAIGAGSASGRNAEYADLDVEEPQQPRSRTALVVDLQSVISTQDGEVHPPKDSLWREMRVSDAIMAMWRRKILADIKLHSEMGSRLAAGYWRQVGNF